VSHRHMGNDLREGEGGGGTAGGNMLQLRVLTQQLLPGSSAAGAGSS
jgi:hypothetical protein